MCNGARTSPANLEVWMLYKSRSPTWFAFPQEPIAYAASDFANKAASEVQQVG